MLVILNEVEDLRLQSFLPGFPQAILLLPAPGAYLSVHRTGTRSHFCYPDTNLSPYSLR